MVEEDSLAVLSSPHTRAFSDISAAAAACVVYLVYEFVITKLISK